MKNLRLKMLTWCLGRWARYTITNKCTMPVDVIAKDNERLLWVARHTPSPIVVEPFAIERTEAGGWRLAPTGVSFSGVPNHAMQPLNFAARRIMAAFFAVAGRSSPNLAWEMEPIQRRRLSRDELRTLYGPDPVEEITSSLAQQ